MGAIVMIGKSLGHYQIIEKLGQGGMGEVYRARDEHLSREVAVKVLPAAVANDPERLSRFRHEAQALAALSHPNILAIHDFGNDGVVAYAVTELLEGHTLRQRLESERLPWHKSVEIAAWIAEALAAAHGKGIIHRDIKPENIFITSDGRIKVLDFGLARIAQQPSGGVDTEAPTRLQQTDPGVVLGTMGYMSPEQVRGQVVGAPSDIFALGCLLYEMLTGKRAFARETAAETMTAILKDPAPEVTVSGVEATPELNRIVAHCLEKNPGERFQSASDLAFHLRSLLGGAATVRPETGKLETAGRPVMPSIAVLPFANLSPDPDQEYFCDGMAEEIINVLSRIGNLQVVARTSAFSFKGKNTDIREIGRKLNVNKILEGSVRRSGNRLRITAQLINVADGYHLWSERYDRNLEDIFGIQDEISLAIADNLKIKLLNEEKETRIRPPTANVEAYQLYMRGRFYLSQGNPEGLTLAIDYFKQAIDIDPRFALAYAGIADSNAWLCAGMGIVPPTESIQQARESALKAVELGPEIADTHTACGMVATFFDWDRIAAGKFFRRALALNSNSASALCGCGMYLMLLEHRHEEALEMLDRAKAFDPLNILIHLFAGSAKNCLGKCDEVIAEATKWISPDPLHWHYYHMLGEAYGVKGAYQDAIACYQEAIRFGGRSIWNIAELGFMLGIAGKTSEAEALLKEVLEAVDRSNIHHGYAGFIYLGLGQYEKTLDMLEKSCAVHDPVFLFYPIAKWAGCDELRQAPRYKVMLAKAGLSHLLS